MPLYEHVFLARQDISAQQVEGLLQTFRSLLEENGGKVGKTEYWGLKTLAYRIKKNRKAHYTLMDIDAPHEAVAELERQMGLSTDIIRFMTIKIDEHEEGPSAMMRRSDRDDRGDRGDRGHRRGPHRDHAPREARTETPEPRTETPEPRTETPEPQNKAEGEEKPAGEEKSE